MAQSLAARGEARRTGRGSVRGKKRGWRVPALADPTDRHAGLASLGHKLEGNGQVMQELSQGSIGLDESKRLRMRRQISDQFGALLSSIDTNVAALEIEANRVPGAGITNDEHAWVSSAGCVGPDLI